MATAGSPGPSVGPGRDVALGDPLDVVGRALTAPVGGRRLDDVDPEHMVGRAADPWP